MFGVLGWQLHLMARGIDRSEVEEREGVKSVSHETTFEVDTADAAAIMQALECALHRCSEGGFGPTPALQNSDAEDSLRKL